MHVTFFDGYTNKKKINRGQKLVSARLSCKERVLQKHRKEQEMRETKFTKWS
jgi:hypothetical protein